MTTYFKKNLNLLIVSLLCCFIFTNFTVADTNNEKKITPEIDKILKKIEKRYKGNGFSALFFQKSTLKAMEITDTASGRAYFKKPAMMRWEYDIPERQYIITNGKSLWIYKPEDNQVLIGKFPTFFGNGKGVSFLSDIRLIREIFFFSMEPADKKGNTVLKLIPKKKNPDLTKIYLYISKENNNIVRLLSYNEYEDETRIDFFNINFKAKMKDSMFVFNIPDNSDIVTFDK